jgi:hypothetical protein
MGAIEIAPANVQQEKYKKPQSENPEPNLKTRHNKEQEHPLFWLPPASNTIPFQVRNVPVESISILPAGFNTLYSLMRPSNA